MSMSDTFWLVAVLLGVGVCYKVPAIVRLGGNPLARQVGGLLIAATAVFFFAAPAVIAKVNDLTGIVNFSAPWVYSLITGFSASCLLLIIKWRGGSREKIRRATWWVYGSYGALLVGLWLCFTMGDHRVERLRDLDTYYATTPWMREMILLYLAAHTAAVLITSALLWNWERTVRGTGWLHTGVVLLTVGYALNLSYDAVKLTAVIARWNGHNLDYLSTDVAPPIAAVVGLLIGLGFVVPHIGDRSSQYVAARREYRALAPLARTLEHVPAASAPVALGRTASLRMRLTHRRTFVRDALRHLHPFMDVGLHKEAVQRLLAAGKKPKRAQALADAAAITAAVERMHAGGSPVVGQPHIDLCEPVAISRALRALPSVHADRCASSTESVIS
ncbi:MAB_1171c family putative transporter [Streptomyces anthocyanicus]|uniref:MAB_1171c family putative transporter n=1 Tax=Streptomyces anthocyanicus TaxID=68174 RepID=UPI0037F6C1E3